MEELIKVKKKVVKLKNDTASDYIKEDLTISTRRQERNRGRSVEREMQSFLCVTQP